MSDEYVRTGPWRPLGTARKPKVTRYRVADPRYAVLLNRYPFSCIGIGIVLGRHCYSFVWGRPGRYAVKRVDDA